MSDDIHVDHDAGVSRRALSFATLSTTGGLAGAMLGEAQAASAPAD